MTNSQKFQLDPPFSTGQYVKVAQQHRPTNESLEFAFLPAAQGLKSSINIIHVSEETTIS